LAPEVIGFGLIPAAIRTAPAYGARRPRSARDAGARYRSLPPSAAAVRDDRGADAPSSPTDRRWQRRDYGARSAGENEIQDVTANLNGITVTDCHARDTLNFTDLSGSDVTAVFLDGVLTMSRRWTQAPRINLPGLTSGASFIAKPNGIGGTLVSLAAPMP